MAYMNQERKATLAPAIKAVLKQYGVKGTISVDGYQTLSVNIKSGPIDFIDNYNQTVAEQPGGFRNGSPAKDFVDVNPYWFREQFQGKARAFMSRLIAAMNQGNWNNSRSEIDYFDVGWYIRINIGKWNKPYILTEK